MNEFFEAWLLVHVVLIGIVAVAALIIVPAIYFKAAWLAPVTMIELLIIIGCLLEHRH